LRTPMLRQIVGIIGKLRARAWLEPRAPADP
jgi:hypothetical protein